MTPRVAHLWLDDFFVAVERRHAPPLLARPLVIGGRRDSGGRVVAASVEARACGVHPGQLLRRAARLCPAAISCRGRSSVCTMRGLVWTRCCGRWSPRSSGWRSTRRWWVSGRPRKGPRGVWPRTFSTGSARFAGTSLAVGIASSRTAARVAARRARPRGLLLVLPGYDRRFLAGCDIGDLDADQRLHARLTSKGLATVGALADLDDDAVIGLVGRAGLPLVRAARGEDGASVARLARPRRLVRSGFPGASQEALTTCTRALLGEVRTAMWAVRCVAHRVGVRLEDGHGSSCSALARSDAALASSDELWRAAAPLVTALSGQLPRVREVVVSVAELDEHDPQESLFGPVSRVLAARLDSARPGGSFGVASLPRRRTGA